MSIHINDPAGDIQTDIGSELHEHLYWTLPQVEVDSLRVHFGEPVQFNKNGFGKTRPYQES